MNLWSDIYAAAFEYFIGALIASIIGLGVYFYRRLRKFIKERNIRHFWSPFIGDTLTIIFTEYPVDGEDRLSRIAQIAGAGRLISKGMALAIAKILEFCEEKIVARKDILLVGDRSTSYHSDNLIILGSPANNPHARSMAKMLNETYEIPYYIEWNEDNTKIEIKDINGEIQLAPYLGEDGFGEDFALIIKADYQTVPKKTVILVFGCYMWGTQAGGEAITNPKILNEIAKHTRRMTNLVFIIKTRIVNFNAGGPIIDFNNRRYILAFSPKE